MHFHVFPGLQQVEQFASTRDIEVSLEQNCCICEYNVCEWTYYKMDRWMSLESWDQIDWSLAWCVG